MINKELTTLLQESYLYHNDATRQPSCSSRLSYVVFLSGSFYYLSQYCANMIMCISLTHILPLIKFYFHSIKNAEHTTLHIITQISTLLTQSLCNTFHIIHKAYPPHLIICFKFFRNSHPSFHLLHKNSHSSHNIFYQVHTNVRLVFH